ncbi:hypothetical protein Peur_071499 [Populus x canadensis]
MRCLFLFTHGRDHFESLGLSGNNCCRWFDMFTESRYRNQRLISNLSCRKISRAENQTCGSFLGKVDGTPIIIGWHHRNL